ncbi:unnamed protein product [Bursaphelenchus xylophilus]|uniref:Pre-rRNA-processing protein TSR1 homolog n=1 Tax=Bursaphelenchus xylophilus TaxID=6326 RepID=A0A811KD15_BURXY|nr:unnamed protein product [Bursaphelenchus xylophilus]CAG9092011.1 unnamed protein product [Bursaphelenchus xylophilus]
MFQYSISVFQHKSKKNRSRSRSPLERSSGTDETRSQNGVDDKEENGDVEMEEPQPESSNEQPKRSRFDSSPESVVSKSPEPYRESPMISEDEVEEILVEEEDEVEAITRKNFEDLLDEEKEKLSEDQLKEMEESYQKRLISRTSLRGIKMLMKCRHHRNIVGLREIVVGDTMDIIFLVMEFVEHDVKALNVPSHILNEIDPRYPLALYGLLKHENKFSVMNVVLRKYNGCKIPIKNKESLVFHVGSRRFVADPIFSEHSTGDKFKMERFMPEGTPFVASFYGPVTFGPCPVLVFKRDVDGNESFVAYGSVLDPYVQIVLS